MKTRATALFIVLVAILVATLTYYSAVTSSIDGSQGTLGPWNQTTSFPFFPADISCAAASGYIYCVGGYNGTTPLNGVGDLNSTYYGAISPNGVSSWNQTTAYPIGIQDESCITSLGYIYCVGGYAGGRIIDRVYYASVSSTGIGQWINTTTYPYPVSPHCMTDASYIYCEGAEFNGTAYSLSSGEFYAASLSPSGVGNWIKLASLPSATAGCSSSSGYAYCIGGGNCPPPGPCDSPSYYTSLSSSYPNPWFSSTQLPTAVFATYAVADSYLYYFTSPIYYAHLSSTGISGWGVTTSYPAGYPAICVGSGDYIYCIGGWIATTNENSNGVYFASIKS